MDVSASAILVGGAVGLAVAMPVGPMGILCIQRSLARGWRSGLATGAGAAAVHTIWCAVVLAGVSLSVLATEGASLVCAGLLAYWSARILARPVSVTPVRADAACLAGDFASAVALCLANPLTILLMASVAPGLSADDLGSRAPEMMAGVALGSLAWWAVLASAVAALRARVTDVALRCVNLLAGGILAVLAVRTFVGAFAA